MAMMTIDEHMAAAKRWAEQAPKCRIEDYTIADCYAKANWHLLMALLAGKKSMP
jgi:hypothetical protein